MWPFQKKRSQVALVAAAKNEAAYLAEWVFHHLYFGFDPIEIHVNRSDDGTEEIARQIAALEPRLHVFNADDLDQRRDAEDNIQIAIYKRAHARLLRDAGRRARVAFLDIDEFWTPMDGAASIQSVLSQAGWPRIAAFHWFNRTADAPPFGPALQPELNGFCAGQVKSCFLLGTPYRQISAHGIEPYWPGPSWSASGSLLAGDTRFETPDPPAQLGPAFVLHRINRSPIEYLGLLGRLRPLAFGFPFKDNRRGFEGRKSSEALALLQLPEAALGDYAMARERAMAAYLTAAQRDAARQSVRVRARAVLSTYLAMPKEQRRRWKRLFSGLDIPALRKELGV